MGAELVAFLAVAAVVICTPGPDTALTVRNTLAGGRRAGVMTAVGVALGQAFWTVATSAGVATLLSASEPAFLALRLAGAAYLVLLGAQSLRAAFRSGKEDPKRRAGPGGVRLRPSAAVRQGLLSNLGNPKMAAFFTSLLPQLAPAGGATFAVLLLLGLAFASLTLAWLSVYAVAVARARRLLLRGRVRRALDALAGSVLVALGVRLASERR